MLQEMKNLPAELRPLGRIDLLHEWMRLWHVYLPPVLIVRRTLHYTCMKTQLAALPNIGHIAQKMWLRWETQFPMCICVCVCGGDLRPRISTSVSSIYRTYAYMQSMRQYTFTLHLKTRHTRLTILLWRPESTRHTLTSPADNEREAVNAEMCDQRSWSN